MGKQLINSTTFKIDKSNEEFQSDNSYIPDSAQQRKKSKKITRKKLTKIITNCCIIIRLPDGRLEKQIHQTITEIKKKTFPSQQYVKERVEDLEKSVLKQLENSSKKLTQPIVQQMPQLFWGNQYHILNNSFPLYFQ